MFKKEKNFKGVSLIEVLIVIVIIAVTAAISYVNLTNARRQTAVSNTCNELASFYNKARNYALTGKVVGGSVPTFFKMIIPNGNTSAIIYRSFNSDGSLDSSYSAISGDQLQFKNGVTCRRFGSGGSNPYGDNEGYYFQVPNGDTVRMNASLDANIECSNGISRTVNLTNYNGFKAECL
jgi:prepilin-type N-terminal cleavage/methylation domain-containing protein